MGRGAPLCFSCGESAADVAEYARETCLCDFADEADAEDYDYADRYDAAMDERREAAGEGR